MTPEEREEWARRFSYREHISSNDVVAVGALLVPFMLLGFGVVALATGDGVGRIGGVLLLLLGGVVMTWAWHYFSRPVRPDNDEDFERELRYRIADEQRRQRGE